MHRRLSCRILASPYPSYKYTLPFPDCNKDTLFFLCGLQHTFRPVLIINTTISCLFIKSDACCLDYLVYQTVYMADCFLSMYVSSLFVSQLTPHTHTNTSTHLSVCPGAASASTCTSLLSSELQAAILELIIYLGQFMGVEDDCHRKYLHLFICGLRVSNMKPVAQRSLGTHRSCWVFLEIFQQN